LTNPQLYDTLERHFSKGDRIMKHNWISDSNLIAFDSKLQPLILKYYVSGDEENSESSINYAEYIDEADED